MIRNQGRKNHIDNPLGHWGTRNKGTQLVLLLDDSDDRPSDIQKSSNLQTYVTWHAVAIPRFSLESVERGWMKIKQAYNIPGLYLHCNEHSPLLMKPESEIRLQIKNLLSQYGIVQFFSSRSETHFREFVEQNRNADLYHRISHNWALNQHKEQSLFWFLDMMDRILPHHYFLPEAVAFCDKTERSESTFRNRSLEIPHATWGWREYPTLTHIHHRISSRLHISPRDIIGRCLDLADYSAWMHQRVFRLIRARDFADENISLTKKEWLSRTGRLSMPDQEICNHFLELLEAKAIRHVRPHAAYKK